MKTAARLANIEVVLLPFRSPELMALENLWRGAKAVVEPHRLPAACHVQKCFQHSTEPAPAEEVACLNRKHHSVIVGYASETARERGTDRLFSADLDRSYVTESGGKLYREYGYCYAVKLHESELHWSAWMIPESA